MAIYLAMTLGTFAIILGLRRGDVMFETSTICPASRARIPPWPSAWP